MIWKKSFSQIGDFKGKYIQVYFIPKNFDIYENWLHNIYNVGKVYEQQFFSF